MTNEEYPQNPDFTEATKSDDFQQSKSNKFSFKHYYDEQKKMHNGIKLPFAKTFNNNTN